METYIQDGTINTKEELLEFSSMYVSSNLASGDAIFVKEAYEIARRYIRSEDESDLNNLLRLDQISHAIKLSNEVRKASMMMGRQFLNTVHAINDSALLKFWLEHLNAGKIKGHYCVAYGIYAAIIDADLSLVLEGFFYSSSIALVLNAVRAIPLGQSSGVQIISALLPEIKKTAKKVMGLGLNDLDNNTIALEIASIKHEFLYSRIFIS